MDAFVASTGFAVATALLTGLIVGSFLNVVIHRLPRILEREWRDECEQLMAKASPSAEPRLTLSTPGSHCPACKAPVKPWQNIPVISYLLLRGRCASCGTPIPKRYPLVELTSGALTAFCLWWFGVAPVAIAAAALTWALIALAVIDIDHQILPDRITMPLIWVGLLLSLTGWFTDSTSAIIGAAGGYLLLWLVFQGFRLATGKEGMGFGDFKLLAVFGAWLGWQMLPLITLAASIAGALVGVILIATGRRSGAQPIPFGPFLAGAGWVALFWGADINRWYLDFSGLG
ncbi:MAG: A24 family peptidase [Pseudomonadota bacterium]